MTAEETRRRSYRAAAGLTRDRMRAEAPDQAAALDQIEAGDIVVVQGSYDHVELVLDALGLPYGTVQPHDLARLRLRPEQLVVVNCPGHVGTDGVLVLRRFVEEGGSLFTTDWALRHVIEPAFPGVLAYNDRPTADDVVRIEVVDAGNRFLAGVLDGRDDPQWWLEGSSYPIRVLAPERVEVLLTSREMGEKYGEAPVAVLFRHGEGEVFHMTSHYYLQRTELRTARHAAPAASYWSEKGVPLSPAAARAVDGLTLGDVESAASSARLFANVIAEKKRRAKDAEQAVTK